MGVDTYLFNIEDREYIWLGRVYLANSDDVITEDIVDKYLQYDFKTLIKDGWIFDREVFYCRYWMSRLLKDYIRNSKCPIIYKTDYDHGWEDFVVAHLPLTEFDLRGEVNRFAALFGWLEGMDGYYV